MNTRTTIATALALTCGSAFAQNTPGYNEKIPDEIMTPDKVETSIGTLNFADGIPDAETTQKLYDNLDTLRAVETFLNFVPATSLEGIRQGHISRGATECNQMLIFKELMDSNPLFLTGNTDTVYCFGFLNLDKDGPTVVEIPPGCGPGTVDDAYFRFVIDMGPPGPDRGEGGKYLIVPPGYEGELPKDKKDGGDYYVAHSRTYAHWMPLRGFLVDGKPDTAVKMFQDGVKIYPLSKADNPPAMEFISCSKEYFNTIHANTYEFYEELNHVIQREPVDFIEPELRGIAASIGIVKGKEFAPDERMKKILTDGVAIANGTARAIAFRNRDPRAKIFEDRQWMSGFIGGDYRWLGGDGLAGRDLDARTFFFYQATVNTPAMAMKMVGKGSQYALVFADKDGEPFDGSKNYKLHIPANAPAKNFWSVVVYDPQTRSELQTSQPFPSKNNTGDTLVENADGSVDLYFGPKAPEGKEANWVATVPSKGWFACLRLYGPLEPWFDKTWKPGDIELVK